MGTMIVSRELNTCFLNFIFVLSVFDIIKGPMYISNCLIDNRYDHGLKVNRGFIKSSGLRLPTGAKEAVIVGNKFFGDWHYLDNFFKITRKIKLHKQLHPPVV